MWIKTREGFANLTGIKSVTCLHTREGYVIEALLLGTNGDYVRLATYEDRPAAQDYMQRLEKSLVEHDLLINPGG